MPAVLFLHGANDRLHAAATWIASRGAMPGRVVVFHPDSGRLGELDRLLWTASGTGFLPHCRQGSVLADETPILMTDSLEDLPPAECLVNLGNAIPPAADRFNEIVEIISNDDAVRLPGRERFKHYRSSGYAVNSINLAEGAAE